MKMYKNPIIVVLLLLFLMPCVQVFAQNPDLPSEEVDVVKQFDARLLDTERIPVDPVLPPADTTTKRQRYEEADRNINVEYLPPKIRPLGMRSGPLQKAYNGYARLGAGLPTSFLGQISYFMMPTDDFRFGFDLNHYSLNNNNNVENQRFSYNDIGAEATYYAPQGFAVDANVKYTANNVYFYGYNDFNEENGTNFSFEREDIQQRFTILDFGAKIYNGERTAADFNYSAGFDLYNMDDEFAAREFGFKLVLSAQKWFNEEHPLQVDLITDFTNFRDTAKQDLNNFHLKPNYTFHGEVFQAKIGANVVSNNDDFFLFPDAELSALFELSGFTLGAFIGASGDLQKNSFRNLSDYNQFIESSFEVANTSYYHYYGGIKGNIQGIDFRAQVGYKDSDNLATFLTNGDSIVRFDVFYDTASIFTISGSLTAPLFKGFELTGAVVQNIYSTDVLAEAYGLPSTTINVGAKYTMPEYNLTVRGDLFVENGIPFFDQTTGEEGNLNGLFDISLGLEFFFVENIGAFVQLNNLANNKRQRWHRYPTVGLNALLGISARF